jgi:hypothetical protein
MKLTYTATFDDYKASFRLGTRRKRTTFILLNIVVPILAVSGLLVFPHLHITDQTPMPATILIAGLELLLIYLSIAIPIDRFFKVRKAFKRSYPPARADQSATIDIDDERILSVIPGLLEVSFRWDAIVDFAQDDRVSLFFVDKDSFFFFPTSALSPEQRTELNELVARHLPKGKR